VRAVYIGDVHITNFGLSKEPPAHYIHTLIQTSRSPSNHIQPTSHAIVKHHSQHGHLEPLRAEQAPEEEQGKHSKRSSSSIKEEQGKHSKRSSSSIKKEQDKTQEELTHHKIKLTSK
jgi:hypothetical protein